MTETQIYGLADPKTGEIKYVGKANNAEARYKGHLRDAKRRKTPVYQWINSLEENPKLIVLASCTTEDWQSVERQIIAQHRAEGELLNLADGGNQPKGNPETNRQNAIKMNERMRNDPHAKRIQFLKRSMSDFIRRANQGKVREEFKEHMFAKLRLAAAKNPSLFGEWRHI